MHKSPPYISTGVLKTANNAIVFRQKSMKFEYSKYSLQRSNKGTLNVIPNATAKIAYLPCCIVVTSSGLWTYLLILVNWASTDNKNPGTLGVPWSKLSERVLQKEGVGNTILTETQHLYVDFTLYFLHSVSRVHWGCKSERFIERGVFSLEFATFLIPL